jgi:hypothetical protein
MRSAALVSWLVTVSLGAFMLRTWLARGGLRRERARAGGLPPPLVFGHAGLAVTGLLIWSAFLATGVRALAWTAIGVMMVAIGLGLCTVTLWTPYPARRPGERRTPTPWDDRAAVVPDTPEGATAREGGDPLGYEITDEMIARFLEEPAAAVRHGPIRPIRPNPAVLVPIAHGFGAISTFVLAVMATIK